MTISDIAEQIKTAKTAAEGHESDKDKKKARMGASALVSATPARLDKLLKAQLKSKLELAQKKALKDFKREMAEELKAIDDIPSVVATCVTRFLRKLDK